MKLIAYLRSIRWFEIAVRMGAPFVAMLIACPVINAAAVARIVHALAAFFLGWAHGYTMNEWGGYAGDAHDPLKSKRPLLAGMISRREIFVYSLACAAACVILYYFLDPKLLFIVALSLIIGFFYNHPRITLKKIPFASLGVLFIVSINDTLLGWLVFSPALDTGLVLGVFFGLIGLAGICYHEARDHESDRAAGMRTNAVRFGKKLMFKLGIVFYTLSCMYFILLTIYEKVPGMLFLGFLASFPVYLYFVYRVIRLNMTTPAIHDFITQYRILYGVIGAYMIVRLCT